MKENTKNENEQAYTTPKGSSGSIKIKVNNKDTTIHYEAGWTVLRKREVPFAEMFSVSYSSENKTKVRPITFVMNGGPGASSAFLHVGALGPKRVGFTENGGVALRAAELIDNKESWLAFTDLVFIDPIGSGLSRTIDDVRFEKHPPKDETEEKLLPRAENNKEFWSIKKDLDAIGEFIERYLNKNNRWLSPIYIAGESYGGYRVAKLARSLQEQFGIGLEGVCLISPALEPNALDTSDYDSGTWLDAFPSYAFAAAYHGKSKILSKGIPTSKGLKDIESFALEDLTRLFQADEYLSDSERKRIFKKFGEMSGLDISYIEKKRARVAIQEFARKLLEDKGLLVGLYDASVIGKDPFPNRDSWFGPDPTLSGIDQVFASGINHHIRNNLKLKTDRRYHLLSEEAFINWKNDISSHIFHVQIGAVDDLRYSMALSERTKVWITHGYYDLVTPFFSSRRLSYLMQLDDKQKKRLSFTNYLGGHMFYSWEKSRKEFYEDARKFYR